jgi:hypothetical protein
MMYCFVPSGEVALRRETMEEKKKVLLQLLAIAILAPLSVFLMIWAMSEGWWELLLLYPTGVVGMIITKGGPETYRWVNSWLGPRRRW